MKRLTEEQIKKIKEAEGAFTPYYLRVESPDRNLAELLDEKHWWSTTEGGVDLEGNLHTARGLSVCRGIEEMQNYDNHFDIIGKNEIIVVMKGEESPDEPYDSAFGESLLFPTEIIGWCKPEELIEEDD